MRIEKTYLFQVDTKITQDNDAVKPGMPAEDKVMKDAAAKDRDPASSAETTDRKPVINNRKIQYFIHEKTGDIMAKVYDAETNEVIREIPPEKIKDLVANMLERAGLLVDERA